LRILLSELEPGEAAVIDEVALPEAEQQLLIRFGFFDGAEVRCSRRAPLGDPTVYSVDGSEVALRAETACRIFASTVERRACEQTR
jgi:Fe2+ transport system protein FeoA